MPCCSCRPSPTPGRSSAGPSPHTETRRSLYGTAGRRLRRCRLGPDRHPAQPDGSAPTTASGPSASTSCWSTWASDSAGWSRRRSSTCTGPRRSRVLYILNSLVAVVSAVVIISAVAARPARHRSPRRPRQERRGLARGGARPTPLAPRRGVAGAAHRRLRIPGGRLQPLRREQPAPERPRDRRDLLLQHHDDRPVPALGPQPHRGPEPRARHGPRRRVLVRLLGDPRRHARAAARAHHQRRCARR